jgi:hypothetical protein
MTCSLITCVSNCAPPPSKWFSLRKSYLYDHLGATPFDAVTSSRYWMAGLVAGGYLCVVLTPIVLVGLGRGRRWLPAPGRVMAAAVAPLVAGVLVVTAWLGTPRLPWGLAALVSLTTVIGAYLALWAAHTVQQRRWSSLWLALDGAGLVPVLTLTQVIELPGRGLSVSPSLAWGIMAASLVFGVVWRAVMAWVYRRVGMVPPRAWAVVRAGLALGYVGLPALHHWIETPPGYKYITTADNFMARSPWLLAATWATALLIVLGAERLAGRHALRQG